MTTNRSYPVPLKVAATVEGSGPLAEQIRLEGSLDTEALGRAVVVAGGSPLGQWAESILHREVEATLNALLPDTDVLPQGVLASGTDDDIVIGLLLDGSLYDGTGWVTTDEEWDEDHLIELDEDTVAAVADALQTGADGLVLRPWVPLAVIAAAPVPGPGAKPKTPPRPGQKVDQPASAPTGGSKPLTPQQASKATGAPETDDITGEMTDETTTEDGGELPPEAKVVAVVDELDKTAVIELIAIAPGPKVFRRNDGTWGEDDKWLTTLRSVSPPPLVQLSDPGQIADVVAQVDEATKGMPFDPNQAKKKDEPAPDAAESDIAAPDAGSATPVAASADWVAEHQRRADELAARLALVGASKATNTVKGKAMGAEKLRQYWLNGEGALKIRWGAPGDWRRCVRHLSKFMGPRATGYCALLHARKTGAWTGSKVHRKAHGGIYPNAKVKGEAIAKELSH